MSITLVVLISRRDAFDGRVDAVTDGITLVTGVVRSVERIADRFGDQPKKTNVGISAATSIGFSDGGSFAAGVESVIVAL